MHVVIGQFSNPYSLTRNAKFFVAKMLRDLTSMANKSLKLSFTLK